jgi:hypothetical protein
LSVDSTGAGVRAIAAARRPGNTSLSGECPWAMRRGCATAAADRMFSVLKREAPWTVPGKTTGAAEPRSGVYRGTGGNTWFVLQRPHRNDGTNDGTKEASSGMSFRTGWLRESRIAVGAMTLL